MFEPNDSITLQDTENLLLTGFTDNEGKLDGIELLWKYRGIAIQLAPDELTDLIELINLCRRDQNLANITIGKPKGNA